MIGIRRWCILEKRGGTHTKGSITWWSCLAAVGERERWNVSSSDHIICDSFKKDPVGRICVWLLVCSLPFWRHSSSSLGATKNARPPIGKHHKQRLDDRAARVSCDIPLSLSSPTRWLSFRPLWSFLPATPHQGATKNTHDISFPSFFFLSFFSSSSFFWVDYINVKRFFRENI